MRYSLEWTPGTFLFALDDEEIEATYNDNDGEWEVDVPLGPPFNKIRFTINDTEVSLRWKADDEPFFWADPRTFGEYFITEGTLSGT